MPESNESIILVKTKSYQSVYFRIMSVIINQTSKNAYFIGAVGITMFSLSLPMTNIATGSPSEPQLSGLFIAFGRAVIAGILSVIYLYFNRVKFINRQQLPWMLLTSFGVVFGFPLFLSIGIRHVGAVHASVILGILPMITAICGAVINKEKATFRFWICGVIGCLLVMGYILQKNAGTNFYLGFYDLLVIVAMFWAGFGYVCGAKLAKELRAIDVISWAVTLSLPLSLVGALYTFPETPIMIQSWLGLVYLGVFSMWIGFFFWYKALNMGGTVRISQLQLAQPFMSIFFSYPLLGEIPDSSSYLFCFLVILTVYLGKKKTLPNPFNNK